MTLPMVTMAVSASTGVMSSLLGKLSTLLTDEYRKIKGVRNKVASLHEEFSSMNALLVKLAGMDVLDGQAKVWRDQVREMSYDIEDCIDDFMHDLEVKGATTGFLKKTGERLKKLKVRHQIGNKLQRIEADVLAVHERRLRYKLDDYTPASSIVPVDPRALAIYAEAAGLVGIDAPRDELLELLMDQDQELKVASIVGFGGLGKTTLANEVRRKIEGQFSCHAFVSVSQKPDIQSLLQNLFFKLTKEQSPHNSKLDDVIDSIREYLLNKRYFIIIDDLWDSSAWDAIKCAFPENNNGSRLLTTTRIHSVAAACCSKSRRCVYKMRSLNKQDSRRLFFRRIFGSGEPCPGKLEEVSMDILKKCGGLPLAIASISSLLADQPKSKFEYVRNSLGFIFEGNSTLEQMKEILELSYRDLPHHLKTCLLYLGMYPEDREIYKVDLLRQWIAESFVTANSSLDVEDVALSYFNELINRNMIQPLYSWNRVDVYSCRVHDIMLEVIRSKIEEENFIAVLNDPNRLLGGHRKIRRVSLQCSGEECMVTPAMVNGSLSQVRSIVVFGWVSCPSLTMLKYVRVLHLDIGIGRDEVVDLTSLPELFLLRYLTIRSGYRGVRLELPSQIGKLQQLETLDLGYYSCKLPSDIVSLPRLLHLIVFRNTVFPDGIGRLGSLHNLRNFDLWKNSVENIEGLGKLTNLRDFRFTWREEDLVEGTRRMDVLRSSLERISGSFRSLTIHLPGASGASFGSKSLDGWNTFSPPPIHLQEMTNLMKIGFCCRGEDLVEGTRRMDVLHSSLERISGSFRSLMEDGLQCLDGWSTFSPPPIHLQEMLMMGCVFSTIPTWIAHLRDLQTLVFMVRGAAFNDDGVAILAGLPSLVDLSVVVKEPPEERVLIPGSGMAFQALKTLRLHGYDPLLTIEAGAMPRLQELVFNLYGCERGGSANCAIAGIEHLPACLKNIWITIIGKEDHEVAAVKSSLKRAFEEHHPSAHLRICYGTVLSK